MIIKDIDDGKCTRKFYCKTLCIDCRSEGERIIIRPKCCFSLMWDL